MFTETVERSTDIMVKCYKFDQNLTYFDQTCTCILSGVWRLIMIPEQSRIVSLIRNEHILTYFDQTWGIIDDIVRCVAVIMSLQ